MKAPEVGLCFNAALHSEPSISRIFPFDSSRAHPKTPNTTAPKPEAPNLSAPDPRPQP